MWHHWKWWLSCGGKERYVSDTRGSTKCQGKTADSQIMLLIFIWMSVPSFSCYCFLVPTPFLHECKKNVVAFPSLFCILFRRNKQKCVFTVTVLDFKYKKSLNHSLVSIHIFLQTSHLFRKMRLFKFWYSCETKLYYFVGFNASILQT